MPANRRTFLGAATAAAGVAASRLPAAATVRARGSLQDVEHIVVLMQENRSFDHYFGALRGVRGFGDPRPVRTRAGEPVWAQRSATTDGAGVILPFRLDTRTTAAGCIPSLDHSWRGSYDHWKRHDVWIPEKGPLTMGHLTRDDLPYYYALADAFTVCDAYHCSIFGPTTPNRQFLFTGTNGISAGHRGGFNVTNEADDNPGADMAADDAKFAGFKWTPYALRLEAAGVSWRVYQEYDNYSDNPLGYFATFRGLDRASSLYRRGRAWVAGSTRENAAASRGEHLVAAFAADVAADRLPSVAWLVAPEIMSEHPAAPPAYGQSLTARLIAALAANPAVWSKTVFILNFDENDGFFDHMPPPTPPTRPELGASTVDLQGETHGDEPVGLGPRVPCVVVSPWTRGGWVNSQLFDHTSVLRLMERRFGVAEPNISPWRRAVCGDLLSTFDFDVSPRARADTQWLAALPATTGLEVQSEIACRLPAPRPAATPRMPTQEAGSRPARALPYALDVVARLEDELVLSLHNRGAVAAVFTVYAANGSGPWTYTVGAGRTLDARWSRPPAEDARYDLSVHGPDGFFRSYAGAWTKRLGAQVSLAFEPASRRIALTLHNPHEEPLRLSIDRPGAAPQTRRLGAGSGAVVAWKARRPAERWYDVTVRDPVGAFAQRLAGHFDTGEPGVSEPRDA